MRLESLAEVVNRSVTCEVGEFPQVEEIKAGLPICNCNWDVQNV